MGDKLSICLACGQIYPLVNGVLSCVRPALFCKLTLCQGRSYGIKDHPKAALDHAILVWGMGRRFCCVCSLVLEHGQESVLLQFFHVIRVVKFDCATECYLEGCDTVAGDLAGFALLSHWLAAHETGGRIHEQLEVSVALWVLWRYGSTGVSVYCVEGLG